MNANVGVAGTVGFNQRKELARMVWVEADAAMRGGASQPFDGIGAMNGVTAIKEDRMGHGGVVVFLRKVFAVHSGRFKASNRGAVAASRG